MQPLLDKTFFHEPFLDDTFGGEVNQ